MLDLSAVRPGLTGTAECRGTGTRRAGRLRADCRVGDGDDVIEAAALAASSICCRLGQSLGIHLDVCAISRRRLLVCR
jgi:hypothetical protein